MFIKICLCNYSEVKENGGTKKKMERTVCVKMCHTGKKDDDDDE